MSVKLENWADIRELVRMSIGTDKGTWWADANFGSELWLLKQNGKVDGQTAGTLRRMVLEALIWLVADGLVKEIDCRAERSGKDSIVYQITIHKADWESTIIREVWNVI